MTEELGIEQFIPTEVVLSKTINGVVVEVATVGLDDDGKVYCVSYHNDYDGSDLDQLLEENNLEKAVIP